MAAFLLGGRARALEHVSSDDQQHGEVGVIGWGTTLYGFIAGVGAASALVYLLIGARRRFDVLMVSFGVFAGVATVATLATIRLHRSTSVDDYVDAFKVFGFASYLSWIALVGLVIVWTSAVSRPVQIVWAVASGIIGIIQIALPEGLLAGPIDELRTVSLLGETFVIHASSPSSWRWILDVYLAASLGLVVVALIRGYRIGHREATAAVTAALSIGMVFTMWDSYVDSGGANTPYLTPIGFLIVGLGGAAYLGERVARSEHILELQRARLEDVVVDRTEALTESNRRLAQELTAQQRAAENLSLLTSEFENSNRLVDSDLAVAPSLQRLVDLLAATVPARLVRVDIDERTPARSPTTPRSWSSHDAKTDIGIDIDELSEPDLHEPIRIKGQRVGSLTAWLQESASPDGVEAKYVRLASEHLSGLFERLDLIREIAVSAVEAERRRIARDLHDSVTQRMYSVSFLADALVRVSDDDPVRTAELAQRARELVLSSLVELRSLLFELRPDAFDDTTLTALIDQLGEHSAATSNLEVAVDANLTAPLPPDVKVGLYRIAQEALSNACRHSGGAHIHVTLSETADVALLAVHDDGKGFDPSGAAVGHGIGNLRERAISIGADLHITSTSDSGTTVEARWSRQSVPIESATVDSNA